MLGEEALILGDGNAIRQDAPAFQAKLIFFSGPFAGAGSAESATLQTALSGKPDGKVAFGPARPPRMVKAKGAAKPMAPAPAMRARRLSSGTGFVFEV